ncbi:MAG TPA: MotA/TolQ/ExbB proton channel family protein [Treponemataceae bacterium]|jgi:biopolymer transport protein ExbB|nr:MotA/TolQ/ExbB proton channel family protein [Treponemataceae bacterium]
MFEVLKSGGVLIIPILVCAVLETFIIIERMIYFYVIGKNRTSVSTEIISLVKKRNYDGAIEYCRAINTPLTNILKKAVECRNFPVSEIREAVTNEATHQIPLLERFITPLGTIANIATLLGLMGTVTGNIQAFGVLGSGGSMGNPEILAGAIAEALVTTAAGLAVSIPALIFHNYFVSRINRRMIEMEYTASELVVALKVKGENL